MNRTECSQGELQSYHKGQLQFLKMEIGMWKHSLQKGKEKGRECFVGSVAPQCLPSSVRQVEGATVLTLTHLGQRTAHRLEHTGHPYLTAQHTRTTCLMCGAAAFGTRVCNEKPTLQLQVGGKQVRKQLMWDARRTHAAHLNVTLSAPL